MEGLGDFLRITSPDVVVLGSPINYADRGNIYFDQNTISNFVNFLINFTQKMDVKVYSFGYINSLNTNKSVSGDIDYCLLSTNQTFERNYTVSCNFDGGSGKKSERHNLAFEYAPDDVRDYQ